MAFQSIWYSTNLSQIVIDELIEEIESNVEIIDSRVYDGKEDPKLKNEVRNSKNGWIPSNHWISGYVWHFVNKANNSNFRYDIRNIDNESMQYTSYDVGQYYQWHSDTSVVLNYSPETFGSSAMTGEFLRDESICDKELSRKLSFSLQLSNEDEYEGGELQFMDDDQKLYCAPKERGTLIIFDSRVRHRVRTVKKGNRKSLVGWIVGPRWK